MTRKLSEAQRQVLRILVVRPHVSRTEIGRIAAAGRSHSGDKSARNARSGSTRTLSTLVFLGLAEPLPEDRWQIRITPAGRAALEAAEAANG